MEWLLILVGLGLVAACGAFVAAEFSLVTADRNTLERAAADGERGADGALKAVRSLSTQLSGAQVGITITNLGIGFLAEPSIAALLQGPLDAVGIGETLGQGISVAVALILSTAITMIFGELVPKNLAIARPIDTARRVQGFQRGFTRAMSWPISGFNNTANWILSRFGMEAQEELASARTPQELASLFTRSGQQGTLEQDTAVMLAKTIAFGDRRASDVMTPRPRMATLEPEDSVLEVYARARETGFSRFPVVPEGVDQVVGVVHVKHVVEVAPEDRVRVNVGDVMVEPVVVPSSIELDALLELLREGNLQLAIVVDEFGGVDGVVTMEDLIEELVGDVVDEHDNIDASAMQLADGSWDLSGLLRPDEVTEHVGVPIPEDEEYETIAGLLTFHLERIPEEGDSVQLTVRRYEEPDVELRLEVTAMHGLRVDRIRMELTELPDPDEEHDDRRADDDARADADDGSDDRDVGVDRPDDRGREGRR